MSWLEIEAKARVSNPKLMKKRIKQIAKFIKKEVEFTLHDIKKFLSLLKEFGFKKWIKKIKETWLYSYKGVSIELNKVRGLGWFVEVEYLCQGKNENEAKKKIRDILKILKIKKNMLEKKGYTRLLYEKNIKKFIF